MSAGGTARGSPGAAAWPSTARGDKGMQKWVVMGYAGAGPGNNTAVVCTYTPALTQPPSLLLPENPSSPGKVRTDRSNELTQCRVACHG